MVSQVISPSTRANSVRVCRVVPGTRGADSARVCRVVMSQPSINTFLSLYFDHNLSCRPPNEAWFDVTETLKSPLQVPYFEVG